MEGRRPWLQGTSNQLPFGHITARTLHGDLLTAHSTQNVPLATGTLQAQRVVTAAGGRGGLAVSPHRGEEGRTGQAHGGRRGATVKCTDSRTLT